MKTPPVKSHTVWSLSLVLSLPVSPWQPSSVQPGHSGLCQDGSGAELGWGSGEVTLEAALCLGISPWDPTEKQECGPELAEGHLEGWPGWCLAPHKCPGGMGSMGEFPLCQQQPCLRGGAPTVAPEKLANLSLKGASPRALLEAGWGDLGSIQDH